MRAPRGGSRGSGRGRDARDDMYRGDMHRGDDGHLDDDGVDMEHTVVEAFPTGERWSDWHQRAEYEYDSWRDEQARDEQWRDEQWRADRRAAADPGEGLDDEWDEEWDDDRDPVGAGAPLHEPVPHAASGRGGGRSHGTARQRRRWFEVVCGALVAVMAVWELAMVPVKALLIKHLSLSCVITTDQVAEVGLGARAAFNHHRAVWLPLIWLCAAISTLKWHVVAFWAGKLWGQDALAHWSGSSPRNQRITRSVVWLARRAPVVAIAVGYVLAPVAMLVYAALGAAGLGWKRMLQYDIIGAMVATFGWIYLGFYLGTPAVRLLDRYSHVATWFAVAAAIILVAFVIWRRVTRDTRRIKSEAKQQAREEAQRRIAAARAEKTARRNQRRGTGLFGR